MRADLIDIQVEDRGEEVEISLYGILGEYQLSAVREKLEMLVRGPGVFFFVNTCEKWRIKLVDAAEMPLENIAKRRIGDALERA